MKTQLRLLLFTIALTVLIWTYADRAGHETSTITVPVTIAPADPDSPLVFRIINARPDEPNVKRIKMRFRGPKSNIRLLETEYGYGGFALTVPIADDLTPGRKSRNLLADLSRLPEITKRGLTLDSISPEAVEFDVDRYLGIPVEVKPVPGAFEEDLDGKPIVEPQKVEARVLESEIEGPIVPAVLPLLLEDAIAEELRERPGETGDALTFDAPLPSTWRGVEAIFRPDHVTVTLRLKRHTVIEHIAPIQLGVLVKPQDFFSKYEIEWLDKTGAHLTQDVEVRVPIEKRDEVRAIHVRNIDAYVRIYHDDLPQESSATESPVLLREVQFVFPPGFEDVKPREPLPRVEFRIKRKLPAAGAAPSPGPS